MFSCHLANEDRLFIPTRKVFNYIHLLFLRNENEIGVFTSSVYPRTIVFLMYVLVFFTLFSFCLRASCVERTCRDPLCGLQMLVGVLIWWLHFSHLLHWMKHSEKLIFKRGFIYYPALTWIWNPVLQKQIHCVLVLHSLYVTNGPASLSKVIKWQIAFR